MSGIDERPKMKEVELDDVDFPSAEWDYDYVARSIVRGEFQRGMGAHSMMVRQFEGTPQRIVDDVPVNCRRCGANLVLQRQDRNCINNTVCFMRECSLCGYIIKTVIEGV